MKMKKRKRVRIRIKRKTKAKATATATAAGGRALTENEEKKALMRKKRRVLKAKRRLAVFAVFFVMVGGAAAVFKAPVFNIKEIVCVGGEKLSEQEIIKASGVKKGSNVFLANIGEIKQRISKIPYVSEYNARRIFPNKIKIWIREAKPAFVVKTGKKYAVCDTGGKVLELADKNKEDICELIIPDKIEPAAGKMLGNADDPKFRKITECINLLENINMLKKTNTIDFSDISDIILYYDGRLKIKLGNASELDYKLRFAEKVIRENISDVEKATVDYTGDKLYVGPYDEGEPDAAEEKSAESVANAADGNADKNNKENENASNEKNVAKTEDKGDQ